MLWIQFIISAAMIIIAGVKLTAYADLLSLRWKLGKVWIGVILLGLITSLPEIITSVASVISLGAINLAVGNVLGSNTFNPVIIVIMDIMYSKGSVTNKIQPNRSHIVSAFFAIILSVVVIIEIFLSSRVQYPHFGLMSMGNLLIVFLYFLGMKKLSVLSTEGSDTGAFTCSPRKNIILNSKIYFYLLSCAILVIVGAIWLANVAESIAEMTRLGQTFFGSLFLAFVTSLPEIVVSVSALKIGAFDLAIGNIFGSNMTNIFAIFLCSLCYSKGPILSFVSMSHIWTAFLSIVISCIAIVGIKMNQKKTIFNLGWDSISMAICFIAGMGYLYKIR